MLGKESLQWQEAASVHAASCQTNSTTDPSVAAALLLLPPNLYTQNVKCLYIKSTMGKPFRLY